MWATSLVVAILVVVGVLTGALWGTLRRGNDLFDSVGYGLPAVRDGRWWTCFTGMWFAPAPPLYLPILAILIGVGSSYERRVGHARLLAIVLGGQLASAGVTALFLSRFSDSRWAWTRDLATRLDVGISGGALALIGAMTAVMQPVWRRRVRIAVGAYALAMLLNSGRLWDLEHAVGFLIGVGAGPFLIGQTPRRPQLHFGPRSQRAAVALVVALLAITALIEGVFRGNGGPFHIDLQPRASAGLTLSLVISSLLLLVSADGLRRGRRVAWAFVTALVSLTIVVALAAPPSAERNADLLLLGAQLVLLLSTVRAFSARSQRHAFRRAGRRLLRVVVLLFVYTALGFAVLQDAFTPKASPADMITEFLSRLVFTGSGNITPTTTAARWFVRSIGGVWLAVVVGTVAGLLYSSRRPRPVPRQDERLRALLREHHSSNIGWMLTWRGNSVWFTADGRTAIGYQVVGSVALCLADPVGPISERQAALRAFDAFCFERGWTPCLFAAGRVSADLAPALGWQAVEVAEDSIVHLADLEFRGKPWQDVRTAINKAGKADIRLVTTTWAASTPVVTDQLRAISGEWVSGKALPEMGFTLGTLREADDPEVRLHLAVGADQTIEGFTSWLPVYEHGRVAGWTLDLMRRRDQGFRPVMEFLIAASAMQFKDEGYEFVSLSAAPLAKAPDELGGTSDRQVLQELLDVLGRTLEPYYGFQSLFAFKQKFQPEHQSMYLVFPDETALVEIGIAVARAYVPGAGLLDWARMLWEVVAPPEPADDPFAMDPDPAQPTERPANAAMRS